MRNTLPYNAQNPVEESQMATLHPTYARGSAKPLISGKPKVVGALQDFADDIDVLLSEVIETTLVAIREDIRKTAARDQEWAPLAEVLDVEYVDGEFHYVLDGDPALVEKALELEYGGPNGEPNSLIRKMAMRHPATVGKSMSESLSREVPVA